MEIGGIDADYIVNQLMAIEERPLIALQSRQADARVASDALGRIRSKVDAFRLASDRLSLTSSFDRHVATVSNTTAVAATISGTSAIGSLSFTVDQLAQSHGLRSIGTVASDAIAVTSDSVIAVASGTRSIGIDMLRAGAGLGVGEIEMSVTQATAAASVSGTTALASSTTVDGFNELLDVTVNGVAHSLSLAFGTYDEAGLVSAVQDALDGSGVEATASLNNNGQIELATAREGSTADIQITGGNALIDLGLAVDASAHIGTDGIIDIDGTTTTVTLAEAGQAIAVDTGSGTLDATLSGGLRVGAADVNVVSTGDRSLSDVAAAITTAGAGVTAAAVLVDTNTWRLQLSATSIGEDGRIAIDDSVFSGIGGMVESSAARNAEITIGSGAGAYQVEASGNTFSEVVPGVTLTAKEVSTTQITVSVARDDATIADDVSNMISSINDLLADIKVQTRTDPTAGTSGALAGNATVRQLADQVGDALGSQVNGLTTSLPSDVGIERDRDGSFTFDRNVFLAAIAEDPSAVARLFGRGGTDTGDAVFAVADPDTMSGTYAIEVTTAASRASSALLFDGGAATASRIGIRIDSTTTTLDVQAGQSASQIVQNLNTVLAEAGLDVIAETEGTGLRVRADDWGSAGDFELNLDVLGVGTWDAQAGTDVQGTIDGFIAAGSGRRLVLAATTGSPAAGLGVDIADGVSGVLGDVDYVPGIAARIVETTSSLTRTGTGVLVTAKEFAERRIEDFGDQIERLDDRLNLRETNMRRQWASLQTLLAGLQTQGDWLSGQLSSLSTNWAGN